MAFGSKKPAYITIPAQLPNDERNLDKIGQLIEAAKQEYQATHSVGDDAQAAEEVDYASLVDMNLAGVARVLVVDPGRTSESILAACGAAGLTSCLAHTEDMAKESQLALADETICIGPVRGKGIFEDNYAILSAAEVSNAQAILLVGSVLADDERFLSMAAEADRAVWRYDDDAAGVVFGGTTKAWLACTTSAHMQAASQTTADSWMVCPKCRQITDAVHMHANHKVCPSCGHHFRMTSLQRIEDMVDAESFIEFNDASEETDPLDFPGYADKIEKMRSRTGISEGVRCGQAKIAGMPFVLCIMDSTFFMGSMGSVVGERIARAAERATQMQLPLVIFCASGGARMQEGLVSLMQMAKISAAIAAHSAAGLPYFSVITDPTTGGVTASFAMQGDVIISEPRALIGFAGRRVIQDTIRQELPKEFQTAEFALEHGLIDAIVPRDQMRDALANLLALYATAPRARSLADAVLFASAEMDAPVGYAAVQEALKAHPTVAQKAAAGGVAEAVGDDSENHGVLSYLRSAATPAFARKPRAKRQNAWERKRMEDAGKRVAALLSVPEKEGASASAAENPAWHSVQMARDTHRPTSAHYVSCLVDGFFELHGDRGFADDGAIVAGIGWVGKRAVMVISQEKGENLQERIKRNFGCPQPEGYRKSLRLMRSAEKFGIPVVCLVDTQGAFCGKEAEERGQGNAIADNLFAMANLRTPIVSVLIGEGGSGGALALAVADRVAMQKHAVYSVLSPEGFASILWKDRSRAAEAAAVMRMSAEEIYSMDIVDAVLEEGPGSASKNPDLAANAVRRYVMAQLDELCEMSLDELLGNRYARFRKF